MTTDLEKQFFSTFGIEPRQTCKVTSTCNNYVNYNDCNGCNSYKYPQITDCILLKLIYILNTVTIPDLVDTNIDRLKKTILEECITLTTVETATIKDFINDIYTLFEENSND